MSPVTKLRVIDAPSEGWVDRLRKGNWVWLVKESQYARVAWEWEPPDPGHFCGRIAIERFEQRGEDLYFQGEQSWYVTKTGGGLDGDVLMRPLEDNLPEKIDLPEPEIRRIHRELERLNDENARLSVRVAFLEFAYAKYIEEN